ncbi:MAG TPA: S41 family peptidase, partial [Thermomicrobiales bacterium]|nr:S41 family peptidase [Thermomicrobiales bacterium]
AATSRRQARRLGASLFLFMLRGVVAVCLLGLVFGTGLSVGRYSAATPGGVGSAPELEDADTFEVLGETWRVIQENYVDVENIDEEALIYGASQGMVEALGDTGHSRFLDPASAEAFTQAISGRRVGVGISLEQVGEQYVIAGVFDGTPADEAGIKRGDIILAVDGHSLDRLSPEEIRRLFPGEEGTLLDLRLARPVANDEYEVSLKRELLDIDPVSWGMLPSEVAFIRISEFSAGAAKGLQEAIAAAREDGATALVLDLRGNPGGLVFEAVGVASQFLAEGTMVFQQEQRDGSVDEFRALPDGVALDMPMAVLIDEGSASASEIVAGALRDNGRARLLGETTFGTGTVLSSVELDDGSLVVIGTGLWLTPEGESIWKEGVEPDRRVSLDSGVYAVVPADDANITARELARMEDTQLRAAQAVVVGTRVRSALWLWHARRDADDQSAGMASAWGSREPGIARPVQE